MARSTRAEDRWDYVIVGAGSAGSVLAHRLTEDASTRVLLLEAGPPDSKREIAIPAAFPMLMRSEVDWAYWTEPEEALGGRKVFHPRGKTLGGCSSINAQVHQRGHAVDFDGWAQLGNRGWSHADLLPYIQRSERDERRPSAGDRGPRLNVADLRDPGALTRAFVRSALEVGIPRCDDLGCEHVDGVGLPRVSQKRGRRWSVADAYLRPALGRPNLGVSTGSHVTRVIVEGRRAVGVEYSRNGSSQIVRADVEVLLCGGAFNSPQLLLLSGIGDADRLREVGVPPVHDLPGVGRNLQDHPLVGVKFACTRPVTLLTAASFGNLLRYLLLRTGPLTSNVAEALAFVRTKPELTASDLELVFAPVFYDVSSPPTVHAFSIAAVALQPQSTGSVALRSRDPFVPPQLRLGYLSDPGGEDLRVLVHGVRLACRIASAPPLAAYRGENLVCPDELDSDEVVARFVREQVETIYHPVGTCRMGDDPGGVVDAELRVRGLDGLRVIDASVMPRIVRAHPNATVVAMAEKAADLLRGAPPERRSNG